MVSLSGLNVGNAFLPLVGDVAWEAALPVPFPIGDAAGEVDLDVLFWIENLGGGDMMADLSAGCDR